MLDTRRRLSVAALTFFVLAAMGAPLAAQETNTAAPTTVGPPQLKDFRLPGQRTTPPPQTQPAAQPQTPQATPPAPAAQRPAPGASRPSVSRPAQRQTRLATAPATTGAAQAPPAAGLPQAAPSPTGFEAAAPPAPRPSAPPPAVQTGGSIFSSTWLWIGGGLLLALIGFLGIRRLAAMRAAAVRRAQRETRAAERAAAAEAEIAAAAEADAAAAAADALPRARLELGFTPDRAVATDSETIVHYELVLRNVGEQDARNIRIDTRMFNASAQATIGVFLKGPIHDQSGSPLVRIAPGAELKLSSQIAMPKEEVRGITVQGRSIFVPIVAINVAYDWGPAGDGSRGGRTSRSWLVGREPEKPSDKMGAFRLDVGPRIYRSVGQRPTELAHVA